VIHLFSGESRIYVRSGMADMRKARIAVAIASQDVLGGTEVKQTE
jgi:hypothetical protein